MTTHNAARGLALAVVLLTLAGLRTTAFSQAAPAPAAPPAPVAGADETPPSDPQPAVQVDPVPPAAEPPAAPVPAPTPIELQPVAPAPVAPPPAAEPGAAATSGYDKGFFITSADGKHELVVGARVQARYTYEALEAAPNETQFSIARARLQLKGHTLTEDLTYKFQADFGKGQVSLKDFYADYAFVPGTFQLRVGQWKKPFSRQQITSSGNLQFVDRAITDKAFGAGRDIGLAIHDNYEKAPEFEYALGLFNGTGETGVLSGDVVTDPTTGEGEITSGGTSNVPDVFNPTLVARIGYNHGKTDGYSEGDFEGGAPRFGIGASGLVDFEADHDDASSVRAEVDYVLKAYHFSSTGGFYLASRQSGSGFGDRAFAALGAHAQIAYLVEELVEPAFRYELVDPDGGGNADQELVLALSIYPFQHNFKWQTDGAVLLDDAADTTDYRVRSQLQLAF